MNFRILHYPTLDSTNHFARALAEDGACEGTVIVADFQTQGRGRFRRRWYSPRGSGLLFSVILRPSFQSSRAPILTHLAAESVRETLERQLHLEVRLKRPNDVLVGKKKIAGILTEASGKQSRLQYVIVGVGLNVNTRPRDLLRTATSVYGETNRRFKLTPILNSILNAFGRRYGDTNHG